MGLFKAMQTASDIHQQAGTVRNARKHIFQIRDRLRNTPQFSELFYAVISNPAHPPMQIKIDYSNGSFWSMSWDPQTNNYEPFTTIKRQDPNIGYYEGCAFFLLMQECYPNVYDFPNRTTSEIEMQIPIELNMKKQFMNKAIRPASVPQAPQPAAPAAPAYQTPAAPAYQTPAVPAYQPPVAPAAPTYPQPIPAAPQPAAPTYPQPAANFCSACGARLKPNAKFCPICGERV